MSLMQHSGLPDKENKDLKDGDKMRRHVRQNFSIQHGQIFINDSFIKSFTRFDRVQNLQ